MWSLSSSLPFVLRFLLFFSISESKNLKRPFNNSISAIFVFGDSTVDSGNNNYVITPFKGNFPPYGWDFVDRTPTGRFSDGRLVTDFMASYVGIKEYVPPYLDPNLSLDELMTGVSFASAGTGFDPFTARLSGVIPMQKQLKYFKEYKAKIKAAIGEEKAKALISKAAILISAGTNDFVINYLGTPFRRSKYNITSYEQFLLQHVQHFIQGLRAEGAGLIAMVGLPPIGCLPIVITFTSGHSYGRRPCTDGLSSVALDYNRKLQHVLADLHNSSSPIIYADIYRPLNDMIRKPSQFGFDTANRGCCGSGLVETTFLCNPASSVCDNPSKYVFFDSVHPTQATYNYIFKALRPSIDRVIKNYNL
ncbi:Triacylglycerol lipase [Handroanthus impetiginosus]|uniref:Triacylglycerol lipase n=1 Tax=Handroanthus impetiginosus TaxID=429701 RepID=A0A2G9HDN9_9LAMI|nr:Triacylglycerol lipase [Handroanthus impetiginosus]